MLVTYNDSGEQTSVYLRGPSVSLLRITGHRVNFAGEDLDGPDKLTYIDSSQVVDRKHMHMSEMGYLVEGAP
jgi:hypothetical protein